MSLDTQTPNEPAAPRSDAPVSRDDKLFSHLFATRPARQRRIAPWLIAAALHVPLAYLFFTSSLGERMLQRAELIMVPILTVDDNPPALRAPPPHALAPMQAPRIQAETRREPRVEGPPLIAPGAPDPAALVNPPATPPVQPATGDGARGTPSALDRMAPPPADPRLLGPPDPARLLTGVEGTRARIANSIQAFNDSVAAEVAAANRATDWTVRDKDGKRWGVSPGKLHLGDITLPLPVAFATPPGRRDEVNAQARTWNEIEAQASRAEIKGDFNERVKEIRKRKERERAQKLAEKSGDKKSGSN